MERKLLLQSDNLLPFDRQGKQSTVLADANTQDVLSCNEYIYIWILWSVAKLQFGKGNVIGENVLVAYPWATPTVINYMFLASDPQAYWGIPESLYPGQFNCIWWFFRWTIKKSALHNISYTSFLFCVWVGLNIFFPVKVPCKFSFRYNSVSVPRFEAVTLGCFTCKTIKCFYFICMWIWSSSKSPLLMKGSDPYSLH